MFGARMFQLGVNMKNREATIKTAAVAMATLWAASSFAQVTGPTTEPTTAPSANHNGVHGVTTEPGGGMLLNFRDANIENVLDELSAAAGFIVVKEVKPEGRVTLVSKQ